MPKKRKKSFRSHHWFNNPKNPDMTALYLERYLNYGLTRKELQSGNPIIGIAQSGSDLSPCNRHFLSLSERIKDGIRRAGGIPMEFPTHPIQETGKRPPAALMAAATVNIPAIVLSGGPMLDGVYKGKLAGSGMVVWEARKLLAKGDIKYEEFMDMVSSSSPSAGHCNTMGTASSMNSVAEALGMSLPGGAVIPAPYREREQISYETGKRIVGMVHEDLTPSKIMTRKAFENAVVVASAIGGSSNCTIHLSAIAKHMGIKFDLSDWQKLGHNIPLLVNCQPAGEYLMESFHRAGAIPAVMKELIKNKKLHTNIKTVTGKTVGENLRKKVDVDNNVIKSFKNSLAEKAGFLVMKSNFFSSAIMKTSVISKEFKERYLSNPKHPNVFNGKAVVFEGPEDYHKRLNSKKLKIDENSILIVRGCGPVGYPGSAEVVNMQPPDRLLKKGISHLPTLGDGRQSGTSESPSILHVSPESAVGGDLGIVKTGDKMTIDLNKRRVDLLISQLEFKKRRKNRKKFKINNQTPWQEIFRNTVTQVDDGACINSRGKYLDVSHAKGLPRDSH
jgi:dihydroxy-acid dehydratase